MMVEGLLCIYSFCNLAECMLTIKVSFILTNRLLYKCRACVSITRTRDPLIYLTLNPSSCVTSGVQARPAPLDEPAILPRRRVTSEGHSDDALSPDVPVRSPIRCVSPEFVNAIAMNPGGRPKEVENMRRDQRIFKVFVFWPAFSTSAEKHAQLPGGLWGNGGRPCQSYSHIWWWGVNPNPRLPRLTTNPLLQPV